METSILQSCATIELIGNHKLTVIGLCPTSDRPTLRKFSPSPQSGELLFHRDSCINDLLHDLEASKISGVLYSNAQICTFKCRIHWHNVAGKQGIIVRFLCICHQI